MKKRKRKRRKERGEIKYLVRGTSRRPLHVKSTTTRHKAEQTSNQHTQKEEEAILGQKQQSKNKMGSFFSPLSSSPSIYIYIPHINSKVLIIH